MIRILNIEYRDAEDLSILKQDPKAYDPHRILVQVFTGKPERDHIEGLLNEIDRVLPGAPVVGSTSAGEILGERSLTESTVISVCFFERSRTASHLLDTFSDPAADAKELKGSLIAADTKAMIIFPVCVIDGKKIQNTRPLLEEMNRNCPGLIVAGAGSGDNREWKRGIVFTEKGISERGLAAAALSGEELHIRNPYNLEWSPIGREMTVTGCRDGFVSSIDNRSVAELYAHYLGDEIAENLPLSAVNFPILMDTGNDRFALNPSELNDRGDVAFSHPLKEGDRVRFGFSHMGLLLEGLEDICGELEELKPEAQFVYSCESRKTVFGEDLDMELAPLSRIAPSAGFSGYSEITTSGSGDFTLRSHTLTILALSESTPVPRNAPEKRRDRDIRHSQSRRFQTLRVMHNLIDSLSRELEESLEVLDRLARQDALTGLGNRRSFDIHLDQEIRRISRSSRCFSLIMIDIDHFKGYNDSYGHVAGDDCLRRVSSIIKRVLHRSSDTAYRYGGEEFACILPLTDGNGARRVGELLRAGVEDEGLPHAGSGTAPVVTISLGVLTVDCCDGSTAPDQIIKNCDALLYHSKTGGRNRSTAGYLSKCRD